MSVLSIMGGFQDFNSAKKFIVNNQVAQVDLKFTDLYERWYHLTLLASQFTPELMEQGVGFDGSCVSLRNQAARMEFRPPDATCNIYLAMAAQLLAGLDGIQRQIDPTEAGFGPIDANIFTWSEAERAEIKSLPSTLGGALSALADDHEFLLAGDVFSEEPIEGWIRYKTQAEVKQVQVRPHPYEVELYYAV